MAIAIVIIYLLIGLDLLEHINVTATMRDYVGFMYRQGYFPELLLHFLLIAA